MIKLIEREAALRLFTSLPTSIYREAEDEIINFYPDVYAQYVLSAPLKSWEEKHLLVSKELPKLIADAGYGKLIFLGDHTNPWLTQSQPSEPAALFLRSYGINETFNGALEVSIDILPIFFHHLMRITRMYAALPNFHFTDEGENILGSICQYGNVHLSTRNKHTDDVFHRLIEKSRFEHLDKDAAC